MRQEAQGPPVLVPQFNGALDELMVSGANANDASAARLSLAHNPSVAVTRYLRQQQMVTIQPLASAYSLPGRKVISPTACNRVNTVRSSWRSEATRTRPTPARCWPRSAGAELVQVRKSRR